MNYQNRIEDVDNIARSGPPVNSYLFPPFRWRTFSAGTVTITNEGKRPTRDTIPVYMTASTLMISPLRDVRNGNEKPKERRGTPDLERNLGEMGVPPERTAVGQGERPTFLNKEDEG